MKQNSYRARTVQGMPAVRLTTTSNKMELAIMRVEHYMSYNLDPESLAACIKLVAEKYGYTAQQLIDNMRLDLRLS